MLAANYPQVHFEVCNAAYWGVNSHVMRVMAQTCTKLQPDMFLVCMGNNEVHGPFGLKTGFRNTSGPPNLKAIHANIWLGDLRLAQLIRGVPWESPPTVPTSGNPAPARPDDPRLKTIYANFERNLEDICDAGSGAGARVVLSTVGANLRHWPPSDAMHLRTLSADESANWDGAFTKGVPLQEAGSWSEAVQAYGQAESVDDTHAELAYHLGQCLWALGEYEKARIHFTRALDFDSFDWVRAKTPINETITRVAAQRGRGNARSDKTHSHPSELKPSCWYPVRPFPIPCRFSNCQPSQLCVCDDLGSRGYPTKTHKNNEDSSWLCFTVVDVRMQMRARVCPHLGCVSTSLKQCKDPLDNIVRAVAGRGYHSPALHNHDHLASHTKRRERLRR